MLANMQPPSRNFDTIDVHSEKIKRGSQSLSKGEDVIRKIILLLLAVFSYGCASSNSFGNVAQETRKQSIQPTYTLLDSISQTGLKKYPAVFCTPSQETVVGVSFVPQEYGVIDYTQALERTRRQLSYNKRVRVQGEQLSEQVKGKVDLYEEKIYLLEVPSVVLEACRVDTLLMDGRVWMSVRFATERGPSWGEWGYFRSDPPGWIQNPPIDDENWLYGIGIAEVSSNDEAGSWELATYRALTRLAMSVSVEVRVPPWSETERTSVHSVDTRLEGFRVAARWRDDKHLYVLVRVPHSGVVSLLEDLSRRDKEH